MIDLLIMFVQIVIGFYWAGDMARQNPKIDSLVTQLEHGYENFNAKLKDIKITEGLSVLRRVYGWIAIVTFLLFFILSKIIEPRPSLFGFMSFVGVCSVFGWFSIKWCLDHRTTVRGIGAQISLVVFGPILLGIFDLLLHTTFTQTLAEGFYSIPLPLGWEIPYVSNPIVIGSTVSLFFAAIFSLYYIITWLLTVPAAFASVACILLPVILARFIHTIAPRKPLIGLTFVLFTIATLLSHYL